MRNIENKQSLFTNNTIQFIGTNPEDLVYEIKNAVIQELSTVLKPHLNTLDESNDLLTRIEVCTLLKINLSTLHRHRKGGIIPSYGLANKVYFKRSDINKILEKNKLS